MAFKAPKQVEIDYVMQNLRPKSREELEMQGLDPMKIGARLSTNPLTWCVYSGVAPAALIGATPNHSGVWTLFGFGTERWVEVWKLVTLVARKDMFAAVRATGAHRAHAMSPASHTDTHRWLRVLGAKHEVDMPAWGVNGQDFKMFTWLREAD